MSISPRTRMMGWPSSMGMMDQGHSNVRMDDDMVHGNGMWKNISGVVRMMFVEIVKEMETRRMENERLRDTVKKLETKLQAERDEKQTKIEEHQSSIKRLEKTMDDIFAMLENVQLKMDLKADVSYVTDGLLAKVNKSEFVLLSDQVAKQMSSSSGKGDGDRPKTNQIQNQLVEQSIRVDNKVDHLSVQLEDLADVQTKANMALCKIEDRLANFALVSEVNKCMDNKANKQSVSNALHRKANKADVEDLTRRIEKLERATSLPTTSMPTPIEQIAAQVAAPEHASAESVSKALEALDRKFSKEIDKLRSGQAKLGGRMVDEIQRAAKLTKEQVLEFLRGRENNQMRSNTDAHIKELVERVLESSQRRREQMMDNPIQTNLSTPSNIQGELISTLEKVKSAARASNKLATELAQVKHKVDSMEQRIDKVEAKAFLLDQPRNWLECDEAKDMQSLPSSDLGSPNVFNFQDYLRPSLGASAYAPVNSASVGAELPQGPSKSQTKHFSVQGQVRVKSGTAKRPKVVVVKKKGSKVNEGKKSAKKNGTTKVRG